jgi:hypothetical protein
MHLIFNQRDGPEERGRERKREKERERELSVHLGRFDLMLMPEANMQHKPK